MVSGTKCEKARISDLHKAAQCHNCSSNHPGNQETPHFSGQKDGVKQLETANVNRRKKKLKIQMAD
jgi:hypothetical protein